MFKGKNQVDPCPELLKEFDAAKDSLQLLSAISIPRKSDKLGIYTDWSQDANAIGQAGDRAADQWKKD